MDILLATRNRHKVVEIAALLSPGLGVLSLAERPEVPDVVEDAATLEGNARKKAASVAAATGLWCLADDTGLEVEALGGAPGVLSARYAGAGCDYAANNRKLLEALRGVPRERRGAAFRTVMALSDPGGGRVVLEEGRLSGAIAEEPSGTGGFGYDPLFFIPARGKTLAQLTLEEKNELSHRSAALGRMLPHLRRLAALAVLLACLAAPASAGRTEPAGQTIWDQIMADQAHRGLRQGVRQLELKQYEAAAKEFARALNANPNDPATHIMMGVGYYWTGRVDLSLEEYRKALELDPRSAQAWLLIGISLAWKGEDRGAYEAFQKAAGLDAGRADVQMNLGSVEESLGMMDEALTHTRQAVVLDPKNPLYHYQLALLYRRLGRDADCIDSLRRAIAYFPEFEDAVLELGAALERSGDRKSALRSFRKAVDLKARDAAARFRLARATLQGGDARGARAVMGDAFHLTPEDGGGGLRLSVSYGGRGAAAPGAKPSPSPEGDPGRDHPRPPSEDPLSVFSRNLERIPLEQGAILEVDAVFVPKPRLIKAAPESPSSLRKALSQRMSDAEGTPKASRRQYTLPAARPEERARQVGEVLADLRALLDSAPAGADTRLGMNLTFTRLAAAGARGDAQTPPKVSYEPRQVGNDLGLWVIGTGWMGLVEELLPESGEPPAHPDQSDWWVSTGLGYAILGDGQRALAAFERAAGLDPANVPAWLGRSVAAVMTGDEPGAVAALNRALLVDPKNRAAKDGLKWLQRKAVPKESVKGGAAKKGG
jgi:XTP/dITP diphosphohydrolase